MFSSLQLLSRVQLFATPMNHSMPGLPVHHQLPQSTPAHVHRVSDAIQPSQSFPASGSFQMSQLFASGGQSIGVTYCKILFHFENCVLTHAATFLLRESPATNIKANLCSFLNGKALLRHHRSLSASWSLALPDTPTAFSSVSRAVLRLTAKLAYSPI